MTHRTHGTIACGLLLLGIATVPARGQVTTRASVDSSGEEGDSHSNVYDYPALSDNGRFVAFTSWADNLVPNDTNGFLDVFVHDRRTGATTRVSVSSAGAEGDGPSDYHAALSQDGRFVTFASEATNLVSNDSNAAPDVFVHDRDPDGNGLYDEGNGTTVRVSVNSSGVEADNGGGRQALSADGRFVGFTSGSTNLVPGDTNGTKDVFVHDRDPDGNGLFDEGNGITVRVSVNSSGQEGNGGSDRPWLSSDGRFVAFWSSSSNLVTNDNNGILDVFVHDRDPDGNGLFDEGNGITTRMSVDQAGGDPDGDSCCHSISADGRFVSFVSTASDLVSGDTNHSQDVFVHDRDPDGNGLFDEGNGLIVRVSVSSAGDQADSDCWRSPISADGRFVIFDTKSTNLVPNDSNGKSDVFLHDRDPDDNGVFDENNGITTRISVASDRTEANDRSSCGPLSADGRFVAFHSLATNLVPGDTNESFDVFVHGPELVLEADPTRARAGDILAFATWTGNPGDAAALFATHVNGTRFTFLIDIGTFASDRTHARSYTVPSGLSGLNVRFQSFGVSWYSGKAVAGNPAVVSFQ